MGSKRAVSTIACPFREWVRRWHRMSAFSMTLRIRSESLPLGPFTLVNRRQKRYGGRYLSRAGAPSSGSRRPRAKGGDALGCSHEPHTAPALTGESPARPAGSLAGELPRRDEALLGPHQRQVEADQQGCQPDHEGGQYDRDPGVLVQGQVRIRLQRGEGQFVAVGSDHAVPDPQGPPPAEVHVAGVE